VRNLALALDARELLVAFFGCIAQPRFGDTHDAPTALIGVGQLMRKDRLQLPNHALRPHLKKLLGLLDACRILRLESIGLMQKIFDKS
jgi:hypothetical protein